MLPQMFWRPKGVLFDSVEILIMLGAVLLIVGAALAFGP